MCNELKLEQLGLMYKGNLNEPTIKLEGLETYKGRNKTLAICMAEHCSILGTLHSSGHHRWVPKHYQKLPLSTKS